MWNGLNDFHRPKQKVFDSLGQDQIIQSLESFCVTGDEEELFSDLFGRKQSERFRNETSPPETIMRVVPRGSISGSPLFLTTFNGWLSSSTFRDSDVCMLTTLLSTFRAKPLIKYKTIYKKILNSLWIDLNRLTSSWT